MNAQEDNGVAALASIETMTYKRLIKTNLLLKDGTKTHILTIIPFHSFLFAEEIMVGINRGLEASEYDCRRVLET